MNGAAEQSVDLIMTSPPFGLVRKKTYGSEDAHRYCDWFRPFVEGFRRVLKAGGSLVIDIGGAWKPGTPTRSLYHFELLLMLCEDYGFHLCQEHYWWNPSKLPTPAEWVNVRRVRVKDAVNCVWWLSPTPWPKASNLRVLAPYSASARSAEEWLQGQAPALGTPDLGQVRQGQRRVGSAQSSGGRQYRIERTLSGLLPAKRLPNPPARFPEEVPEYFIRMLTDPGDRVLDPFAGSCVTGAVAEQLGRRWTCCELDEEFLKGAMARFESAARMHDQSGDLFPGAGGNAIRKKAVAYSINPPCSVVVNEGDVPLVEDGGLARPRVSAKRRTVKRAPGVAAG